MPAVVGGLVLLALFTLVVGAMVMDTSDQTYLQAVGTVALIVVGLILVVGAFMGSIGMLVTNEWPWSDAFWAESGS